MADQQQPEQPNDPAVDPNATTAPPASDPNTPSEGSSSPTQSDAPVAAREQLQQVEQPGGDLTSTLEQKASDQEAAQSEALQSSLSGDGHDATTQLQENAAAAPAAARAGTAGTPVPTQGGFVDQASRRSGEDALEGHFVRIDLNFNGVSDAYKEAGIEDHRGDYGVYLTPTSLNPDTGIPEFALIRLRDDTNARITVPYDALRPAEAGGR